MPYFIGIGLLALLIALFIVVKLYRSPKFDKFVKEITEEEGFERETKPAKAIANIESTKAELQHRTKLNAKKAEQLTKESEAINSYLGDKEEEGGKSDAATKS